MNDSVLSGHVQRVMEPVTRFSRAAGAARAEVARARLRRVVVNCMVAGRS